MTTRIIPSLAIGASTSASWLVAQLSGQTAVPLGETMAAFVFISGLVWWLSNKMTRIEDDLKRNKEDMREIKASLRAATSERREVKDHLDQTEAMEHGTKKR